VTAGALNDMEALLRLGAFAGVFVLVALWEALAPRRRRRFSRAQRWPHNLGLVALNAVVLRLLAPGAALAVALAAEDGRLGLLNLPALPAWSRVVLALLLLDLAIYLQHRLFHAVPALWRLHRVHHADPDYDVTTGLRFHPIETACRSPSSAPSSPPSARRCWRCWHSRSC
jgi:sterol desaturase/sphingolipid hydroxylase (fatty acid hydroxylase superfamily)